jgi:hypothetical protein
MSGLQPIYSVTCVMSGLQSIYSCSTLDDASPTKPYHTLLAAPGSWWTSDLNIPCYRGTHQLMALLVGIPGVIIIAAGVPLFTWWYLNRNKDKLMQ